MASDIVSELYEELELGPGRLVHTRRAWGMLPLMSSPDIVDMGCGRGVPTLELARLSGGVVTGVDVDPEALAVLKRRTREAGLGDRVRTLRASMDSVDLPSGSFDVVWAEGSLWAVGLRRGLRAWRRLLRSPGFVVVHEVCWLLPDPPEELRHGWKGVHPNVGTVESYLEQLPGLGYEVLGHFKLSEDVWWDLCYSILQERIDKLRVRHAGNADVIAALDDEQREVDLFRRNQRFYGSAFIVMRKAD